jgi:hypothetical protein
MCAAGGTKAITRTDMIFKTAGLASIHFRRMTRAVEIMHNLTELQFQSGLEICASNQNQFGQLTKLTPMASRRSQLLSSMADAVYYSRNVLTCPSCPPRGF